MTERNGYSLVEVMVALGIVGVIATGISSFIINTLQYDRRIKENGQKDQIVAEVHKVISDFRQITLSAGLPGNIQLARCLNRTPVNDCTATSAANQVGIRIGRYNSAGVFRNFVAGTTGNPVFYSDIGKANCDPATVKKCPSWKVRASFWAACANSAVVCAQATTIFVRFQVFPATERTWEGAKPSAVPPNPLYTEKPTAFARPHLVRSDFETNQSCPAGSQQFGYDAAGRIRCECLPNAILVGTVVDAGNVLPVCQIRNDKCAPGLVFLGKTSTGAIRCGATSYAAVSPQIYMDFQRCPPNSWLKSSSRGGCSVSQGASRKDPVRMNCGTNVGTCYREVRP